MDIPQLSSSHKVCTCLFRSAPPARRSTRLFRSVPQAIMSTRLFRSVPQAMMSTHVYSAAFRQLEGPHMSIPQCSASHNVHTCLFRSVPQDRRSPHMSVPPHMSIPQQHVYMLEDSLRFLTEIRVQNLTDL